MRTTVDLSPELLIAAKKMAAELHKPLRFFIEAGLRAQLAGESMKRSGRKLGPQKPIKWVTVDGGLPDVDVDSREKMHEWLLRQQ